MKISVVLLTFNRDHLVSKSVEHNLKNAGDKIDEIVWVDNGSTDATRFLMKSIDPDVSILNKKNLGVAKGYNRGFALSTGDYIIVPGTDTLMPDGWVKIFKENAVEGIACMMKGISGKVEKHCGSGPKIISRSVFGYVGYLREDFGLYGWDDIEWAERIKARGLACVAFPAEFEHLGLEGINEWSEGSAENKEYHEMKSKEARGESKQKTLELCRVLKYPKFNPYG